MNEPFDPEALLDRFRHWLHEARDEALALANAPRSAQPGEEVGLLRLVEEFTALRQEVKLQTKGSRGLQEQTETLLPVVRQVIEHVKGLAPRESQAAWLASKPLAEALADLDEALDRGRAEIEKARRRLVDESAAELATALDKVHTGQSWWRRRKTRAYHQAIQEVVRQHGPESRRPLFDALVEGYGLIQGRLRRAMAAERLERIATVGQPVNPDLMTVVEVVEGPERPASEVVDEVRRGYTWRGRVLRFAEVRATRGAAPNGDGQAAPNNVPAQVPDREV